MARYVLVLSALLTVCGGDIFPKEGTQTISIKGSDTMRILVERLAEDYMKLHPKVAVFVEGGGSGLGIKDLIRNKIDICTASRTIRPEEVRMLAKNFNRIGVSTRVAKDALSVYLNPKNPIRNFKHAAARSHLYRQRRELESRWRQGCPHHCAYPVSEFGVLPFSSRSMCWAERTMPAQP
jgi:ABC-type phosphate transport system substrate-binding protein